MALYPTRDKIEEIFSDRDVPEIFNSYLSDHVDVSVAGEEFHLRGQYKTKDAFHEAIYVRAASAMQPETIRVEVNHVIGGGDSAWAAVHSTSTAISKSGKPYRHEFVDLVRFNLEGKIAQMKEFFDSKHMHDHLDDHDAFQAKEKKTDG